MAGGLVRTGQAKRPMPAIATNDTPAKKLPNRVAFVIEPSRGSGAAGHFRSRSYQGRGASGRTDRGGQGALNGWLRSVTRVTRRARREVRRAALRRWTAWVAAPKPRSTPLLFQVST